MSTSEAREHIDGYDWLRVVGCFLLVWFHTPDAPYKEFAYSGLAMFLLMAFELVGRRSSGTFLTVLQQRARRLLVPWAFWCAVYGVLYLHSHRHEAGGLHWPATSQWLIGPSIHLWYLPYAALATVAISIYARATRSWPPSVQVVVPAVSGLLSLAMEPWIASVQPGEPWEQYAYAAAGTWIGFAAGRAASFGSVAPWTSRLMITLAASALTMALSGFPATGISYGIAALAFMLAHRARRALPHKAAFLADASFGIYLAHPLMLRVTYKLPISTPPVRTVLAYGLAAVFVTAMRRTAMGRRVT